MVHFYGCLNTVSQFEVNLCNNQGQFLPWQFISVVFKHLVFEQSLNVPGIMLPGMFREADSRLIQRKRQIDTLKIFNAKYVHHCLIYY